MGKRERGWGKIRKKEKERGESEVGVRVGIDEVLGSGIVWTLKGGVGKVWKNT
ncbi:hypothetical protein SESBI_50631 [Sesbania bispinosa]|nr:hypothetical protein SESBI_50631 [Sesbania bispinosa]